MNRFQRFRRNAGFKEIVKASTKIGILRTKYQFSNKKNDDFLFNKRLLLCYFLKLCNFRVQFNTLNSVQ
jgi:hypothetical protein